MSVATITTAPETRQIARVITFTADQAAYVNWDVIGRTARELGSHVEIRSTKDGGLIITLFWSYEGEEV